MLLNGMLEPTRPRGTVGVLWGTVRVMCVCGVLYRTQPKQEPRLKKRMRARLPRSNEIRFGADGSFHGPHRGSALRGSARSAYGLGSSHTFGYAATGA